MLIKHETKIIQFYNFLNYDYRLKSKINYDLYLKSDYSF